MIRMPYRSVTRFFIPLIDVLLLLFVIFLLMPLANEDDLHKSKESATNLEEDVDSLEREIQKLREQLQRYRTLEPKLQNMEELLAKLDRLEKAAKKTLQEKTAIIVIDVEGKDGSISVYDPSRPEMPRVLLDNEQAVEDMIDKHRRANPGRDLFYFFLYPRPAGGFPTIRQERTYKNWFRSVANSLKEPPP